MTSILKLFCENAAKASSIKYSAAETRQWPIQSESAAFPVENQLQIWTSLLQR